ncbi:MAG: glycosyltransferase, partial [Tannerellaceae bacterium]|nr:glycosyltransferase [Tannerellaceae bacterium]
MYKRIKNERWNKVNPKITVVTPVYNRRNLILRTMYSVEKQKFRDFEYIIVDDGSTDRVEEVVLPFMEATEIPMEFCPKYVRGGGYTPQEILEIIKEGEIFWFSLIRIMKYFGKN